MSEKYKFFDPNGVYFVSPTLVGWVDLFTKPVYQDIIIDALLHCIAIKGLKIHAWVIMPSHLHLVISAEPETNLANILRDFKRHTNKQIVSALTTGNDSRKEWMIQQFSKAAQPIKRVANYKVWQDGNHPIQIDFTPYFDQKIEYVHDNPVAAGLVNIPEDYRLSSAIDYAGGKGLLPIDWFETEEGND